MLRLTHHSFWELSTKIRHRGRWGVPFCIPTSPHQQQNIELLGPIGFRPPKLDMFHLWHLVTGWWFCCEKTSLALEKPWRICQHAITCLYANMPEFSAIFLLFLRISPRSRNLVPAAPVPKGAEIRGVRVLSILEIGTKEEGLILISGYKLIAYFRVMFKGGKHFMIKNPKLYFWNLWISRWRWGGVKHFKVQFGWPGSSFGMICQIMTSMSCSHPTSWQPSGESSWTSLAAEMFLSFFIFLPFLFWKLQDLSSSNGKSASLIDNEYEAWAMGFYFWRWASFQRIVSAPMRTHEGRKWTTTLIWIREFDFFKHSRNGSTRSMDPTRHQVRLWKKVGDLHFHFFRVSSMMIFPVEVELPLRHHEWWKPTQRQATFGCPGCPGFQDFRVDLALKGSGGAEVTRPSRHFCQNMWGWWTKIRDTQMDVMSILARQAVWKQLKTDDKRGLI